MSIKKFSEIEKTVSDMKYPYVGKMRNYPYMLVLFVSKKTGIFIGSDYDKEFKDVFHTDWVEECFTPIEATIEFGV